MIYFLAHVETYQDGVFTVCVPTASASNAARLARKYFKQDGYLVEYVETEMFDQFKHGDPTDYEILDV